MGIRRAVKLFSLLKGLIKNDFSGAARIMGEMHGLPQKMGQHFTLYRADDFDGYFQALCTRSRVEKIDAEKVLKEIKVPFDNIELKAQASIGQVYKVTGSGGVQAVKIKYPGIEGDIARDFRLLQSLLWPVRFLPLKNNSLPVMVAHLKTLLMAECDYSSEAETQSAFHRLFAEEEGVTVPEVLKYDQSAMVSRWIEGQRLSHYSDRDGMKTEGWMAENYLVFLLKSLKHLGMLHADPHAGNFLARRYQGVRQLVVLDFGAVLRFDEAEKAAVTRLLQGEYDCEEDFIRDLYILGLGEEVIKDYRPILGDLLTILLEPLHYDGEYDFSQWRFQYRINTLLASRAWERPVVLPLKMLLFVRTIQGFYFYARQSRVPFNWCRIIKKHLG